MGAEVLAALAQFGAAGLIAWMWLSERRSAEARQRQVDEAHEIIRSERQALHTLVRVVEDNARAMATLDARQGELARAIERLSRTMDTLRRQSRRERPAA